MSEAVDVVVVATARRRRRRPWPRFVGRCRDARRIPGIRSAASTRDPRATVAIDHRGAGSPPRRRQNRVSQSAPLPRLRTGCLAGYRSQPGDTCQAGMGPPLIVEFPDSGIGLSPPLLDGRTAISTASQWSVSRRSNADAAANSSSASPKASSWNCSLTQLPTLSEPPGYPQCGSDRSSGTAPPETVYAGFSSGPSASSRSETNDTAESRSGKCRARPPPVPA